MTRRVTVQLFALVSLVATIGYALDRTDTDSPTTLVSDRQSATPGELDANANDGMRLREGMKIVNQVGELRDQGGRIAFYLEGQTHSLLVLENLALERISPDLEQPNRKWSVTGVITEYKGGNYLLLQRAVLKARTVNSPGPRS